MSQLMHLSALLTIDTAFTLYMGKKMGSATDPKNFPTPATLHELTYKLLSKAERNFVEKSVDEHGVWAEVPSGKGSIWNLEQNLAIAAYCTDNMSKIQMAKENIGYAYQAVINSRQSTKGNPHKLCDIHVVPALFDEEHIDDYPVDVLKWIDRRFQYVMPPVLKFLKEQGVPCPAAQDITVAEWEELVDTDFDVMESKKEQATAEEGGELASFSEMTEREVEVDLMNMGGDEHVSLFASDFTGTYYLSEAENVSNALEAQKILSGYWKVFGSCKSELDATTARQSFLDDMSSSIKEFKDSVNDQNTGAGIVIID